MLIRTPDDVFSQLKKYRNKRQEHFIVITLDASHSLIKTYVVTIGILNKTIVHPREVFWRAIKDNAAAIVLAHNHPSGNIEPSEDDCELIERLHKASVIMGFQVVDHIIFGKSGYFSFRQNSLLNKEYDDQSLNEFVKEYI